jgi:peptidoglycan/xylan/chitin deacetylase (PgdA/CDA1 family)
MTAKKFGIIAKGVRFLRCSSPLLDTATISPFRMVRSLVICTFVLVAWLGATAQTVPVSKDQPAPTPIPMASIEPQITFSLVHVDGPYIAMTFDDGPSEKLTPKLLNLLAARHIKATFFVVGQNAADHPEILQRAVSEGHEIGNHSWSHPNFGKMSDEKVRRELKTTEDAITKACGVRPTLMRPPYGSLTKRQERWIHDEFGYQIILWDVDPLDWKRPGAKVVTSRIVKETRPGSIVLSHDIHPGTIEAMPETLSELEAKGFKFVTVSELIAMAKPATPKPLPSATPVQIPPHN